VRRRFGKYLFGSLFACEEEFFFFFYYCSVVFTSINVNQVSVSLVNTMMLSEEILVTIRER
jgi:hypothetical protein